MKSQFENAWKQYEQFNEEDEQSYSILSNKLDDVCVQSDSVAQSNLENCNRTIQKEKTIKDQVEKHVDSLRNQVLSSFEEVLPILNIDCYHIYVSSYFSF